jgi:protein transport protein SEC24
MILYIGRNVVPLLLNDLFGPACNSLSDLDPLQSAMPDLDTQISLQLRNILAYISETRPARSLFVQIARQTMDGAEQELSSLLIEDRNNEAQAYQEFLAYLYRQINLEVLLLRQWL